MSRRWIPHLVLAALLAAEWATARLLHRPLEALEAVAASGEPQERLDALHVLANRAPLPVLDEGRPEAAPGRSTAFGVALAKQLYASDDERVKEYAFSTDVCRYEYPRWQEMMVEQRIPTAGPSAHWWRTYVIFKRKVGGQIVGGSMRLRMKELRWFLAALDGQGLEREEALEHMMALQEELQSRNAR